MYIFEEKKNVISCEYDPGTKCCWEEIVLRTTYRSVFLTWGAKGGSEQEKEQKAKEPVKRSVM